MAAGETLAPLIAVVGCDGSGKSTLSADILAHIRATRAAESGYLGLGSGEQGRAIGRWPIIGARLQAFLEGQAARLRDADGTIPSTLAARYALRRSLKRRAKFENLLAARRAGICVVTDRYPQIEVPGLHDGPILAARATNAAQVALKAREQALYAEMASYLPTLVIRLTIDVASVMARKPDHDEALIRRKVATVPLLNFGGAPMVTIDATMDYSAERALAFAAVDAALTAG